MTKDQEQITARTMSALIRLIEDRKYAPGERLPSERELAERFEVGRGVVREVLSVLEGMRYLQRKRNSGIYLNERPERISLETLTLFSNLNVSLSKQRLAEVMEARRILEVQAIMLAAVRRTDHDLKSIEKIIQNFDDAIEHGMEDVADLDYQFHMAIFQAAHNLVLTQLVTPFYLMSENRRVAFFKDQTRSRASNEQHRRILTAIKAKDVEKARIAMSEHIGRVENHYGL